MNRGLKPYTKQITQQVGNAGAISVNVNPNDANMHMTLPLVKTVGPFPIEVGLIYNHQDKDTDDSMVGKGFRLSCFSKITSGGSIINVLNADGSTDTYTNDVVNQETQLKVIHTNNAYEIQDRLGNKIKFNNTLVSFPTSVEDASGKVVNMNFSSTTPTISYTQNYTENNVSKSYTDKIRFTKNSDGLISKVESIHVENGVESVLHTVQLQYSSSKLSNIQYWRGSVSESTKIAETSILYTGNNEITLRDCVSGEQLKCISYSSANKLTNVILVGYVVGSTSNALTTSIGYSDNYSTVTDVYGIKTLYFFDSQGLPLYQVSEHWSGNTVDKAFAVETEFDKTTKRLLHQSFPICYGESNALTLTRSVGSGITQTQGVQLAQCLSNVLPNTPTVYSGTGIITYSCTRKGIAGDSFTVGILGKQQKALSQGKITARLLLKKGNTIIDKDEDSFKKVVTDNNFDLVTLGVSATKSYDKVILEICLENSQKIEIADVRMLAKQFGVSYVYDEAGNPTEIKSGNKQFSISYNADNLPSDFLTADSSSTSQEYDENNNIKYLRTPYGTLIENEYHPSFPTNLISQMMISRDKQIKFSTSNEYSNDGRFVVKRVNSNGSTTNFTYDKWGNLTKIVDALSAITSTVFNDDGTLQKIVTSRDALSVSLEYTYDTKKRLKTVKAANGSIYTFAYNQNNQLASINLNGVSLCSFTYNSVGLVDTQTASNGDVFKFTYNKDMVTKIELNSSTYYTYEYDVKNRLYRIKDKDSVVVRTFTYDADDNVVSETVPRYTKTLSTGSLDIPASTTQYTFDSQGNVCRYKNTFDSKNIYQSVDSSSRSKGSHPQSLASTFGKDNYVAIANGTATLMMGDNICDPLDSYGGPAIPTPTVSLAELIPSVILNDTSTALNYQIPKSNINTEEGCVQFWFKIDDIINTHGQIFTASKLNDDNAISVYVYNEQLWLQARGTSDTSMRIIANTTTGFTVGKWNFFALNYKATTDKTSFIFKLNEECISCEMPARLKNMGSSPFYSICGIGADSLTSFCGAVSGICISPCESRSLDDINKYFVMSKIYLTDNQLAAGDINTIDFGQTVLYDIDTTIQNNFEIFPLHNDVASLDGQRPVDFEKLNSYPLDRDRTFSFNKISKRYAYVANGGKLTYDISSSGDFTVMLRMFTETRSTKQTVFEIALSNGKKLGVYINGGGYWMLDKIGSETPTSRKVSLGKWHTVALSIQKSASPNIRLYCDGFVQTFDCSLSTYSSATVSVGRKFDDENAFPLFGQIEMLAISDIYNQPATIFSLEQQLKCLTKTSEYDEFGLIRRTSVHDSGIDILTDTIAYKTTDGTNYSEQISSENIKFGSTDVTRKYVTDSLGRVTNITDSVFGNHSYTYDYLGRLSKADGVSYTYDKNGNLLGFGGTNFYYDSTVKDKLTEVNGSQVEYSTSDPLNPSGWNGMTFQYEANRLSKFTKDGNTYTYKYNERGQRIAKIGPSGTTVYSYVGDNLVSEKGPNGRLDFLYDEQNTLYGFIKDGTPYYYVRDCLQNILGIIDAGGNLKVKYTTNAWGKTVITSTMDALATQNPFRYKGYYFDTESGMYYCHTRYYVPDWGRWLTADAPAYLDFSNLSYTNLFAYCGNNPVMYIKGGVSLGSDGMVHLSVGEDESQSVRSAAEWLKVGVGAIPDSILGFKYLLAKGIHKEFVYSTRTLYMFPELGANWSRFKIAKHGYGDLVGASIKQIVAGNARAGLGALAKSFCRTAALTGFINFGFNLYENNWQIDGAMLLDTAIDTGIGLAAYGLAVGTVSLAVAGLAMLGLAVPGGIVVVAIIGLSIFFDWAIREITGYKS